MEQKQKKLGIIYSFPICVIMIFLCFPIGFILLFTRFYKNGTVSKAIKNVVIAINAVLLALLAIGCFPETESNESTQLKNINEQELETPAASFPDEIPDITETEEPPTVSEEVKSNDDATEKQNDFLLPEPKPEEETPELNPTFSLPPEISYYDISLEVAQEQIDEIIKTEPLDKDLLLEHYNFLLYCRVNELVFKITAYGHFNGDYETSEYDYLGEEINYVVTGMSEYMGEEEAYWELKFNTTMAYRSLDESVFNYEAFSDYYPDIDAMWEAYFEQVFVNSAETYG